MIKVIKDFSPLTIKLETLDDLRDFTCMLSDYIDKSVMLKRYKNICPTDDLTDVAAFAKRFLSELKS